MGTFSMRKRGRQVWGEDLEGERSVCTSQVEFSVENFRWLGAFQREEI